MGTGPRISVVTAVVVATLALVPSLQAFPAGGGSEISTGTAPANGAEVTQTDQLPGRATQGSIDVEPLAGDDLASFNKMIAAVTDNFAVEKLSQRGRATLGCVLLSYLPLANKPEGHVLTFDDVNVQAALLSICLALARSLPSAATDRAGAARGACGRVDVAVTVQIAHSRSGYHVTLLGLHGRIARPALTVSCRRHSGKGLLIGFKPRRRGQTLRQAGLSQLGVGYGNQSQKAERTRTTFSAH